MSRTNNQLPNLDKLFKDEDDQDFAPLGGSNLAAIFGTPQKLGNGSTPLKQPSQKKPSSGRNTPQMVQQPTNKSEVIVAKVVHAYKLQNEQYSLIGKLGLALTGNATTHLYQIILYRSKQEHISIVTLTPEFSYIIRENNYATYYDDNNENWSILFENENSCIEFAREVGVSRFHSKQTKTDDSVFYQNLTVQSEGNDVKEHDEITVKSIIFTNLMQPLKIDGSAIQTMNVEISQDDNWERSLLNCNKGLKRLLILPPSRQISLGPGFPKGREIIMEIEVMEIIKPEERNISVTKPSMTTGKASILSRMAKMGQSMLPKVPTSTTTDSEDTEEEVHVKSPRRFKSEVSASHASKHVSRPSQESSEEVASSPNVLVPRSIIPTNVPLAQRPIMPSSAFTSAWPAGPIQQQYVTMDGQYYPVHQATVAQPIPTGIDPNINVFLSETRTQNTEIRMGMSKIADNVQKLLDKFHVLEVQSASSPINERALETSLRMMMALNASNVAREESSTDGKNTFNTEFVSSKKDRSRDLEKERRLEKELDKAKALLEEHAKKIGNLEGEKRDWSNEKSEYYARIERLEQSLEEAQIALQKSLIELKTVNDLAIGHQKDNAMLEAKLLKLNGEKAILEKAATNAALEKTESASVNEKTMEIKRIMNKTYQTLLAKFTEESYPTDYIKQTVANTIRNITLQILKEGERGELSESAGKPEVNDSRIRPDELKPKAINIAPDSSTVTEDDSMSFTLPDINNFSSSLKVIAAAQEEPPPIPPMDVEATDGDWLP